MTFQNTYFEFKRSDFGCSNIFQGDEKKFTNFMGKFVKYLTEIDMNGKVFKRKSES